MMPRGPQITQVGLGMDESDEVEQVDAWWNPPPTPPVSCPPSVPPAADSAPRPRHPTISLEELAEGE
jgi:hypothetical protein